MNHNFPKAERNLLHSHRSMCCRMIVIPAILFIPLSLLSGSVQGAPSVRVLRVEKNDIDLGTVAQFSPKQVTFVLRNDSDREIGVYGLRSTCVCSHVDIDTRKLSPGSTAVVTAEVDTSRATSKPTVFHTYVLSRAEDDAQEEILDLTFKIMIPHRAVFSPARKTLDFSDVRAGASVTRRIVWKCLNGNADTMSDVTASVDWIGVDVLHPEGLDGATYVDVRILEAAPQGDFDESVELTFEDESIPRQVFRTTGYVRASVDIFPRMCFLPLAAKDATVLLFRSPSGDAFDLNLVTSDPEGRIEINPLTSEASAIHRIKVEAKLLEERFYETSIEFRATFLSGGKTELLQVPVVVIADGSD